MAHAGTARRGRTARDVVVVRRERGIGAVPAALAAVGGQRGMAHHRGTTGVRGWDGAVGAAQPRRHRRPERPLLQRGEPPRHHQRPVRQDDRGPRGAVEVGEHRPREGRPDDVRSGGHPHRRVHHQGRLDVVIKSDQ